MTTLPKGQGRTAAHKTILLGGSPDRRWALKSPASARLSSGGAECQWGLRGLLLANALTSSLLPLCLPGLDSLDSQMTRAPRVQTLGMASRYGAVGRGGKWGWGQGEGVAQWPLHVAWREGWEHPTRSD